jgi:hypothetical protein
MTGKKHQKPKQFIVMNSQLEYFSGMMYGGQLVWCSDYNEAKPLDDERKFQTLQSLCRGEELVLDYIS